MQADKWGVAIQNLVKIIERNERKLGYFQNRLKQAQFIDRPNQRMVRAAEGQRDSYSDQLSNLERQLRELERLHSGDVKLRTTEERDLRRIWRWINEPEVRTIWQARPATFHACENQWHRWLADEDMQPLSIDLATGELIGFLLMKYSPGRSKLRHATLEFIIIRPDYRHRGYGTDVVKRAVLFAFEQFRVDAFALQVELDNEHALQCFEKSGLGYIDIEPISTVDSDIEPNLYTMGIRFEDWEHPDAPRVHEDEVMPTTPTAHLSAKLLAPLSDLMSNQT